MNERLIQRSISWKAFHYIWDHLAPTHTMSKISANLVAVSTRDEHGRTWTKASHIALNRCTKNDRCSWGQADLREEGSTRNPDSIKIWELEIGVFASRHASSHLQALQGALQFHLPSSCDTRQRKRFFPYYRPGTFISGTPRHFEVV
jgi:hypothetical protein